MKFKKNDSFECDGKTVSILDLLGEGGQGEVYLADDGQTQYALKVYKEAPHPDFIYNLKNNAERGRPSPCFLWPLGLIESDGICGYLMELRPKNYVSFISLLTGKSQFKDRTTLIDWCLELCIAFKKLHEQGFSYQDLNDGSFFLDPQSGALLICDNDNVTANKKNLGILGKMRFMAPEIVRGDTDKATGERMLPDVHSDRFSLAVILFMALCMGNPFEGERLKNYPIVDEEAELDMYGLNPLFVYHKTDSSNRPIRGYHTSLLRRWPTLPLYVKEAFHRTFVSGLLDRENERTTEIEWIKLLCRYRDELVTCACGNQYPYGLWEQSPKRECHVCKKSIDAEYCVLKIGKSRILLEPGKRFFLPHFDKFSSEYNSVAGIVIRNKNNPSIWGIKLEDAGEILIKDSNGNEKTIPAGGVIPIIKNLEIKINNVIGEII